MADGDNDGYRFLRLTIKSWTYYVDATKHEQETDNPFTVKGSPPFSGTREEWIIEQTKVAIDKLVKEMIDEFGAKGITGPPGTNEGSIDWNFKITNAVFRWTSKLDLDQLELLKKKQREFEDKLVEYKRSLKGQRTTLLRFKGATEEEEPDVKKFVAVAKGAKNRLLGSVRVQKIVIERQKKAIEEFKAKIGIEWE